MGKKKIRITAPSPHSRSILKPVIGALLIGGLVWGLASLFEPPPDLVPYTKYKKNRRQRRRTREQAHSEQSAKIRGSRRAHGTGRPDGAGRRPG